MTSFTSKKISVISIWTDKMNETIDFYSRIIGLNRCTCSAYHMPPPHFELGDTFLVLLNGKLNIEEGSELFPVLAISVDNLENACKVLEENGVEVIKGIQEDESSRWTFCKDPGGNLIELCIWK